MSCSSCCCGNKSKLPKKDSQPGLPIKDLNNTKNVKPKKSSK